MSARTFRPTLSWRWARRLVLSSFLLLALQVCLAFGQEFRATITGRVTDAQGAIVPGATITITDVGTNSIITTTSNESGSYTVPLLQPGEYKVSAGLPGFQKFVREGIVLRTAERATVDISLTIGSVDQVVTVTAELANSDTDASTLGQVMENKRVSELPLNGRQAYMLLQLTAGTLFTQTQFGSTGFSGTRAWDTNGNVSIHGSRTGNNEFLIDGAPNAATGGWQYAPVVDAVEEFKVAASSVDAAYGRTGGGVVNLTLKSGANSLHGSSFLFHRGNALDANTTQNNRNGIQTVGHRFDDFGGVLSGPIRHDKTFFMGFYVGFREHIPFPRTSTVPSDLERQGDFSQTFNSNGQKIIIYDPLTTRPDPQNPSVLIRNPFRDNKIPADRRSPVAAKLISSFPKANVPGDKFSATNNYAASPNLGIYSYNSYLIRFDHHFSDRHRVFVNSTGNWGVEFRNQNGFPIPALQGNWPKHRNHYMEVFDDVFTVNATTVLNFRASYDRFNDFNPITYAALKDDLGIKTAFQATTPQYPYLTFDSYDRLFPGTFGQSVNNIYSFQGTLSKTLGKHFVKVGGDFRSYRLNRINLNDANGRFDFNKGFTQKDPQLSDSTSGNAIASLLLGYPTTTSGVDISATSARQYLYYAGFIQDDWKVIRRLTLNLGFRWDYQAPVTERFNNQNVGFDSTSPSPFKVPGLELKGGLIFAGVNGNGRSPYKPDRANFQPRIGLAYEIRGGNHFGLVLRGNYGRSYLPLTGSGEEGIQQTGFSRRTSFVTGIQTGIPLNTLDRPYPDGLLQPFGAGQGLATNIGNGFTFINPDFKTPYVDQWMFGFDIALPGKVAVDIAYVGNRTQQLPINGRSINEVPLSERIKAIERLGGDRQYLSTNVPNPFAGLAPGTGLNGATIQRSQLLRPFPQFTGITMDRDNSGSATYNALEMTANKRLSKGFVAVFNYTFMKSFEATGYLNNGFDAKPWRALSSIDRTHRIAITALYDLPFGKGHRLGGNAAGIKDKLITGWQWNLIGEIQSGTPTSYPNANLIKPTAKLPEDQQTFDRWFDTTAFQTIPTNDFRTLNQRFSDVRNPWRPQWAVSLFKNTLIHERYNLQFRAEAFNVLNTPIYDAPNTTLNANQFGIVTRNQINFPRHIQLGFRFTF